MNPWGVTAPPLTESAFFNDARPTAFLLVEGKSDHLFWSMHVDRRRCEVRAMRGREHVFAELQCALNEGKRNFVAVLDADFDHYDGILPEQAHVVWTEVHDLEALLIASPALDKVLVALASSTKLDAFCTAAKTTVRAALLARAVVIAKLRWLSLREKIHLSFRKATKDKFNYIDYGAFCDRKNWELDAAALVRVVLHFSQRHELSGDALLQRMSQAFSDPLDEQAHWQLCCGHDLLGLLAVALRGRLGSENYTMDDLQERLCLAFEKQHLEATALYRGLRAWEKANAPYTIF